MVWGCPFCITNTVYVLWKEFQLLVKGMVKIQLYILSVRKDPYYSGDWNTGNWEIATFILRSSNSVHRYLSVPHIGDLLHPQCPLSPLRLWIHFLLCFIFIDMATLWGCWRLSLSPSFDIQTSVFGKIKDQLDKKANTLLHRAYDVTTFSIKLP